MHMYSIYMIVYLDVLIEVRELNDDIAGHNGEGKLHLHL